MAEEGEVDAEDHVHAERERGRERHTLRYGRTGGEKKAEYREE